MLSVYKGRISVTFRVPQESHSGPLRFNLFVTDENDVFHYSDILLIADDLKLVGVRFKFNSVISNINNNLFPVIEIQ